MMRDRARWTARVFLAACLAVLAVGPGSHGAPATPALKGPTPDAATREQALVIQERLVQMIERVRPCVVAVFRGGPTDPVGGSGSGVVIDKEGYALTNYHVVGQTTDVRCGLPDGRIYPAKVVGRDPTGDIALLKLSGRSEFPSAVIGNSDDLIVGEWAVAMGNPFNLATDFQPTVTIGIISGLNRYLAGQQDNTLIYTNAIQVDTPINPGNSGGPLFNAAGELVGINGRIAGRPDRGRVNVGTGFAISINQIKLFLPTLRAGLDVYHAQLGVVVDAHESGGVKVAEVLADSAAGEAGIRPGDLILQFNGEPVRSRQHLVNMIGVLPAGAAAVVRVVHGGRTQDLEIELGGLPAGAGVLAGKGRGKPIVQHTAFEMPEKPPTVDDVLAAYVKALGGRQALDAVAGTRTAVDAVIFGPQRISATAVFYDQGSKKTRSEVEVRQPARGRRGGPTATTRTATRGATRPVPVQVTRELRGYDGANGWVGSPTGAITAMPGNELEDLRRELLEARILRRGARPADVTLAYLGQSLIGQTRTDVIRAKGESIGNRWWFFDAATHLLVRSRSQSLSRGLWTVEDYSDYRPVGEVLMPFRVEEYSGGALWAELTVKSVSVEKDLADALFKQP